MPFRDTENGSPRAGLELVYWVFAFSNLASPASRPSRLENAEKRLMRLLLLRQGLLNWVRHMKQPQMEAAYLAVRCKS